MSETPLVLPSPFTFSQSSLQDYDDCPRRFALRAIQRLKWPAVETEPALENERRQVEGQIFHRLVQRHLLGISADALAPSADAPSLSRWWRHYLASEESRLRDDPDWNIYPERTLSAPIGGYRLMAKYDAVAVHASGRALIIDWKTYRKRPRDEMLFARWQTRVYRFLLVEAGASLNGGNAFSPEKIEMRYWFAEYPAQTARFPYSEAAYRRDRALLEKLIAEIAAAREFPPAEDSSRCKFCAYRSYCERGVHAAEGETWEVEESDLSLDAVEEIAF